MVLILCGSTMFCVGGAFMSAAQGFTRLWPSIAVAVCFVAGAACLTRAVSRHGLSTAFVMGLGIEAIGAVLLGVVLLGERPSVPQMGGLLLIVSGVAVLRA